MKRILAIFAAVLFIPVLCAQDVVLSPTVISSAGDYSEAESGNISLSWTLGELAVTTISGDNMMLTQGFQQGDLDFTGFNLDPIEWQIIAYPNPVVEELRIQFDVLEPTDFFIEIQDVTGRLLGQQKNDNVFPGDVILFDMAAYKYGTYFFRISTSDREQVRVITIRKM